MPADKGPAMHGGSAVRTRLAAPIAILIVLLIVLLILGAMVANGGVVRPVGGAERSTPLPAAPKPPRAAAARKVRFSEVVTIYPVPARVRT